MTGNRSRRTKRAVPVERAFGTLILGSLGLFAVCICIYVTFAGHRELAAIQAAEQKMQAEALADRLLLYIKNRVAVLEDYAAMPFASHAVMQPEANLANIADFMDSLSLLGRRSQMVLLDFEGQAIHSVREELHHDFSTHGQVREVLAGTKDELAFVIAGDPHSYLCIAVPVMYNGMPEGALLAVIPLEELGAPLGYSRQPCDSQLILFSEFRKLVMFGTGGLSNGKAQSVNLGGLRIRLVYQARQGAVHTASNRLLLSIVGVTLFIMFPFVGLAAAWGRRTLIAPLEGFRELASRVANGAQADLSEVKNSRIREIQKLGMNFEVMSNKVREREERLREARDTLQERVDEQTRDLLQSEERYALVLESTRIGFWDWNVQTGEVVFSERWAEICGYTLAELEPISIKTWEQLAHPGDLLHSSEQLELHFKGELPHYEVECRMRHKDGHWVWVHDRGMVVAWTDDGLPLRMTGTHADITARKTAEEHARQIRDNLETLFDSVKDFLFVLDGDGRIVHANATVVQRLGYTLDELKELTVLMMHPEDRRGQAAEIMQTMLSGNASCCPIPLISRSGELIPVETHVTHGTWDGNPVLFGISHDITDRKRVEEQVNRISQIQEQLMRLATAFVNISVSRQDEAIGDALSSIGGLIGADRAYLFKYDFTAGVMHNSHEWCAEDIVPEKDNLQNVPLEAFPEWVDAHRKGELVHVPCVIELLEGSNLREILEPQGIQSLIALPLMCESTCFGFVGFDAVKELRNWRKEEIGLLRVLAEMFANFESRRVGEEMVNRLNTEQAALIVEMKKLQQNLIRARDEAQSAARAKGMFLANMSHEIRTPLNAILGYAQILHRNCGASLRAEDNKGLDVIMSSGQHLLHLINDLLALSRNENQMVELNKVPFDFHALLSELEIMFTQKSGNDELTLVMECQDGVPQYIYSDLGKIRQVLINLIGNAIKFTREGWIRVSASIILSEEQELEFADQPRKALAIAVLVEDTGRGIPEDQLENIFMAFEQTQEEQELGLGTGLGLTLSRQYARLLGGDVSVESEMGKGSSFLFSFKANLVDEDFLHTDGSAVALAPEHSHMRLLLVEDDVASRNMLDAMLSQLGFEIQSADNGARALEILEEAPPFNAVLMDKKMPGMDGIETMQRMRAMPEGHRLPILIVTASGMADEEEKVRRLGADGFVPKPIQESRLLKEISRVVGVEYIYEEGMRGNDGRLSAEPVSADALDSIPLHLIEACTDALQHGRIQELRMLADEMKKHHEPLAQQVQALVEKYDYTALKKIFNNPGRNTHENQA